MSDTMMHALTSLTADQLEIVSGGVERNRPGRGERNRPGGERNRPGKNNNGSAKSGG